MSCQNCNSERVALFSAKCSDCCFSDFPWLNIEKDGYVPCISNIGGGDYININVCLECGQLQGTWPINDEKLKDV